MKSFRLLLLLLLASLPGAAVALDLDEAREQGLVGEVWNGYVAAVGSPDARTSTLIREVNQRRRAEYERIARQNDVPLAEIEKVAGQRIIDRSPAGTWIRMPDGEWRQK